jgi:hypothetical protein
MVRAGRHADEAVPRLEGAADALSIPPRGKDRSDAEYFVDGAGLGAGRDRSDRVARRPDGSLGRSRRLEIFEPLDRGTWGSPPLVLSELLNAPEVLPDSFQNFKGKLIGSDGVA